MGSSQDFERIIASVVKELQPDIQAAFDKINPTVETAVDKALSAEAWIQKIVAEASSEFRAIAPDILKQRLLEKADEFNPTPIIREAEAEFIRNFRSDILDIVKKRVNQEVSAVTGVHLADVTEKDENGNRKFTTNIIKPKKKQILHPKFAEVLEIVRSNIKPPLLVGPTGSGKSHAFGQIADTLGYGFYPVMNISDKFEVEGFRDAGGNYAETDFFNSFTKGGLFAIEELDTSDPMALKSLNTATSNKRMSFKDGKGNYEAHDDFRFGAGANTWGTGADSQYVGNQLDASTLDRFYTVEYGYSDEVEKELCKDPKILEFMWALRKASMDNNSKIIVSTRNIGDFYRMMTETNLTPEQIIKALIINKGHSIDKISATLEQMKNNGSDIKKNEHFRTLEAANESRIER